MVITYAPKFHSFSHARLFSAMDQDGDRLDSVHARYGARQDTALVAQ